MAIVMIFDCGATNIRTIAMNAKGHILASHHLPNESQSCPDNPCYQVWDIEQIWQKFLICTEKTLAKLVEKNLSLSEIKGISVTTFGVDGAPFDANGKQLYPIISWKCPRTKAVMARLQDYLDPLDLYQRNGIGHYAFNTLFKLIWLKENQADIYQKMDKWLFISSILTLRLTGNWTTDRTMAGTSMMTNLASGNWDTEVLRVLGLSHNHFPPMKNAGEKVGRLLPHLAKKFGLGEIDVFSSGHDTQFAVFGSGATLNQAVLSSGTWEILMARTKEAYPNQALIGRGLTTELDALKGYFNPAVQWMGSGVIEKVGRAFFSDVYGTKTYYEQMIKEGMASPRGANGVRFYDNFLCQAKGKTSSNAPIFAPLFPKKADCQKWKTQCKNRGDIYRSALEYMASQLKKGLNLLEEASHFRPESVICVGGGSKNALWNQIRADVLNLPIDVVDVAEATVLGSAMFTFTGLGIYSQLKEAQRQMAPKKQRILPSVNASFYQQWFKEGETKC